MAPVGSPLNGLYSAERRWLEFFHLQDWRVADFQRASWRAYTSGASGLIHAPTGTGKTLAAWGGVVQRALAQPPPADTLKVLWITPLRALASDSVQQLQAPLDVLGLDLQVRRRTGDISSSERRQLKLRPPFALVTTPESLSVMLSYADQQAALQHLDSVIVDEWHELLGNKRGVQLQLCLARLRLLNPSLQVWGVSATLGNLDQAMTVLCPDGVLISATAPKQILVDSLRPSTVERYPWAGHLGLQQLPRVLQQILQARSTLVFTNTRSQTELWHQALTAVWPGTESELALHHGSLDKDTRLEVEAGLKDGRLRAVVCTSSLDLGVDFGHVEQVIQIGSPKGIARLLQRAGRCGHQPGAISRVWCVATHALELAEIAAARSGAKQAQLEPREVPQLSLDVLCQHLVTLALGGGFSPDATLAEVRTAWSFRELSEATFQACLQVITQGGAALQNYPDFRRVELDDDGRFVVRQKRIALLHRLNIGTIPSDGQIEVRYLTGARLGQIEENFVARIAPGECFLFAGQSLELKRFSDQAVIVKRSAIRPSTVPRWAGSRMPLSTELAGQLRRVLAPNAPTSPELDLLAPLLRLQGELSHQPAEHEWLIELIQARDGFHAFFYPYAGRLVHEGLAALFARRLARVQPASFSFSVSDYGFCLSSEREFALSEADIPRLLSRDELLADVVASLNMSEMAKRQFRDVARVAGLLHPGQPGRSKTTRQLMVSSGLLFEVLQQHDPDHLLLAQAEREILENQLEIGRLEQTLERLATERPILTRPSRLTPFSFALWAERLRQHSSNESWGDLVAAAAAQLSTSAR